MFHESSPMKRGASVVMREKCRKYTVMHYFSEQTLGAVHEGFRNENLECQTFVDDAFDIGV
jgi:hypothetical protein